jgi:CDGSH-type Zn-finger protein
MAAATIKVTKTGPYIVEGEVQIIDHEGKPILPKGTVIKLCRCGGSTTKPFCDGTHSRIGFLAAEQAVRETDAR